MAQPLERLVSSLDAAADAPPEDRAGAVAAALREAMADRGWLQADQLKTCTAQYARHLLHADPRGRYTVVSLVWDRGQHSPVHAHHTWCGVGVYSGEIEETFFAEQDRSVVPLRSIRRGPGTVSFDAGGTGVHRIANPDGGVAVSIHVYGIAAAEVATGVNRVLG
jgi:predicted metal-dependent enzyme (double-stranded beta helix superfamily)